MTTENEQAVQDRSCSGGIAAQLSIVRYSDPVWRRPGSLGWAILCLILLAVASAPGLADAGSSTMSYVVSESTSGPTPPVNYIPQSDTVNTTLTATVTVTGTGTPPGGEETALQGFEGASFTFITAWLYCAPGSTGFAPVTTQLAPVISPVPGNPYDSGMTELCCDDVITISIPATTTPGVWELVMSATASFSADLGSDVCTGQSASLPENTVVYTFNLTSPQLWITSAYDGHTCSKPAAGATPVPNVRSADGSMVNDTVLMQSPPDPSAWEAVLSLGSMENGFSPAGYTWSPPTSDLQFDIPDGFSASTLVGGATTTDCIPSNYPKASQFSLAATDASGSQVAAGSYTIRWHWEYENIQANPTWPDTAGATQNFLPAESGNFAAAGFVSPEPDHFAVTPLMESDGDTSNLAQLTGVTLSVFSNLPKNNLISCLVAAIGYAFMTTGDYDADGSCVKAQAFAYDKSDFEDAINRTGSTFFDGSQPTADQLADPNWWKHYHARAELVATYTLHHMLEDNYGEAGWIRTAHTTHAIWDGGCSAWKYLLLN